MIKLFYTLFRGKTHDAEQAFADRHAISLLAQQVRDAASAIDTARRSLAVAMAQNEQEKAQHASIVARISDLELRATAALSKGNEALAREAAEAIAYLEAERAHSQEAQTQFTAAIEKLKGVVRSAEARLKAVQRGERLARATEEAQKIDAFSADAGLATLNEAEQTLARLQSRQSQNDMTSLALKAMESTARPDGIIEKLANAGFGPPLGTSADDILERLRNRASSAA